MMPSIKRYILKMIHLLGILEFYAPTGGEGEHIAFVRNLELACCSCLHISKIREPIFFKRADILLGHSLALIRGQCT